MIFGTFDGVHQGHLHLFQQAQKYGDFLIAVVSRDVRAEKIKNKKLLHTETERKKFLDAIKYIDCTMLGDKHDVYKNIKKVKPDVIVLGYDQVKFTEGLKKKLKEFGLHTKIVRAKAYQSKTMKTHKIRERLEQKF